MEIPKSLDFGDHEPIRIPVTGPDKNKYILCEASGAAGTRYNNTASSSLRFVDGKPAGTTGIGHLEPLLVSLCLFTIGADGEPYKPVPLAIIERWPYPVQKRLHDVAKEISCLDNKEDLESLIKQRDEIIKKIEQLQKGESPEKNSPDGMTDGFE